MFREVYAKIETGSPNWAKLKAPEGKLYPWDPSSTYIKNPPFFEGMTKVCIKFVMFIYIIFMPYFYVSWF
jgi:aconitase A